MFKNFSIMAILSLVFFSGLFAKEPTYMQYFYSVKQVMPETKEVGIFITKDKFDAEQAEINKAALRTQIKVKVFLISDMKSIGQNIQNLGDVDILLVTPSQVLLNKSSRMFVLSKCKDKNVPIISSDPEYSQSGALIGLLQDEGGKSKIVLNLKHSPSLASRFTEEFNKKAGIKELIQ